MENVVRAQTTKVTRAQFFFFPLLYNTIKRKEKEKKKGLLTNYRYPPNGPECCTSNHSIVLNQKANLLDNKKYIKVVSDV